MEQQALFDVAGEGEVDESRRALQGVVIAAVRIERTGNRELVCTFPHESHGCRLKVQDSVPTPPITGFSDDVLCGFT